jgi:2,3-bisphosphoglycerate-independent phosphoglycerate mutase
MILDGVGLSDEKTGNAFQQAKKPNIDRLLKTYPSNRVKTSGEAVGLPDGQMGNSEVGHTNIGAGRIIYQELTRIDHEISDEDFFKNPVLVEAINNAKISGRALHLMGLVSDGGVHSHQNHLYALLELAKRHDVKNVYVHVITDGRDTAPDTAAKFVAQLEAKMSKLGIGQIATISGRYYSMDRDNRWDRIELSYNAMVSGDGDKYQYSKAAIEASYNAKIYDEFIKPTVLIDDQNKPIATIHDNDSVIFFNFRPDRARQLTRALVGENFNGFMRQIVLKNLHFVTMTEYDETIKNVYVAYKPQAINNTFGEYISKLGYTQLRIAETEKYAHVTFFFNGGEEKPYSGEDRIMVSSPKVATYDLKPEMSASELADKVITAIDSKKYDVIIMNFANGDMVGHTGKLDKTIQAVEALDSQVGRIIDRLEAVHGEAIITADHGNCEYMIDPKTGAVVTSHSTFDVPIIVVSTRFKQVNSGRLCDITPTLLTLMNESIPTEMTGHSLVD